MGKSNAPGTLTTSDKLRKMGDFAYRDFSVSLIEKVKHKNLQFLTDREVWWQNQLRAFMQNGGKANCFRKDFKSEAAPLFLFFWEYAYAHVSNCYLNFYKKNSFSHK